jgi:hypothetical protein
MPKSELRRVAMIRYEDLNLSAEALEATRHRLVRTVPQRPCNLYRRSNDVGQAIIERYPARCSCPTGPARVSGRGPSPWPARAVELQHSAMAAIFRQRSRSQSSQGRPFKSPRPRGRRTSRTLEQMDILEKMPGVETNRQSVIEASLNCARVFLPRAKRLTDNARFRALKHSKPPLSPT